MSPEQLAAQCSTPSEKAVMNACSKAAKAGMRGVSIMDSLYPESLRKTPDPPAVLFYLGDISLLSGMPVVAVIGSRRCSLYGRKSARTIAGALASRGVCVVSGLARGIDGEAHTGALDVRGATAAVLGGGLDTVYPPEHEKLASRIQETGCLISEYPPGTSPARHTFPQRNRIISGLARAVVVVEAGDRSGTMITVGTAIDQGRDVYAVPGQMGCSTSTGTNRLIRDGAGVVLSPCELLRDLGLATENMVNPPEDSDPLINALGGGGLTVSELSRVLGIGRPELMTRLLELELCGAVIRRPGNIFASAVL